MLGVWLENGKVTLRSDLSPPGERPGYTRTRVLKAGICATDLALQRGYMDFKGVPGHEFVGLALEGPHAGRRVVGEINLACNACSTCTAGLPRHCPQRTVLGILHHGGAFAQELTLPTENLHPVPEEVSDSQATFAEPLAAAFQIPTQVPVGGQRALITGDGRLGLLCAQVLALHGARVDVLGRHPERASIVGPDIAWVPPPEAPTYSLVVEATGHPGMVQQALTWVRPRGTVVLKTTSEAPAPLDLAPLVVGEISLIGSRCGPFEPALRALASRAISVDPMVAARLPLEHASRAFKMAARPGVLKVILEVS